MTKTTKEENWRNRLKFAVKDEDVNWSKNLHAKDNEEEKELRTIKPNPDILGNTVTFNPKLYTNADDYLEAFNKYSTVLEVMDEGKILSVIIFFSQKNENE